MLQGYLELVDDTHIRGWAYDVANPEGFVSIRLLSDGDELGTVTADLYRQDLEVARIGSGNHAFVFHFPEIRSHFDCRRIRAIACGHDGSTLELEALEPPAIDPSVNVPTLMAGSP